MVSVFRLVRKEETKLFRRLPERFRAIPDSRLGAKLMEAERSSDLDFDYIATMIPEEHTGVRIEAAEKSQNTYLGQSIVYQLVKMQENRAVVPYCMRDEEEEDT